MMIFKSYILRLYLIAAQGKSLVYWVTHLSLCQQFLKVESRLKNGIKSFFVLMKRTCLSMVTMILTRLGYLACS